MAIFQYEASLHPIWEFCGILKTLFSILGKELELFIFIKSMTNFILLLESKWKLKPQICRLYCRKAFVYLALPKFSSICASDFPIGIYVINAVFTLFFCWRLCSSFFRMVTSGKWLEMLSVNKIGPKDSFHHGFPRYYDFFIIFFYPMISYSFMLKCWPAPFYEFVCLYFSKRPV